jgi:hypothetical protein
MGAYSDIFLTSGYSGKLYPQYSNGLLTLPEHGSSFFFAAKTFALKRSAAAKTAAFLILTFSSFYIGHFAQRDTCQSLEYEQGSCQIPSPSRKKSSFIIPAKAGVKQSTDYLL